MSKLIVLYQPHQNLRQHDPLIQKGYRTCFRLADKVYWLPTYLTRERKNLKVLSPLEILSKAGLISAKKVSKKTKKVGNIEQRQDLDLLKKSKFEIVELNENLRNKLLEHLSQGDLLLCLGAGSVDGWVRANLLTNSNT